MGSGNGLHEGTGVSRRCVVRGLRDDEVNLLEDFLYEAIFVPMGAELPPRDIIETPELRVYTDGFGSREGDNCLVAELNGKVVGAVWTRLINDYGHVDDETPSLAIALYREYRGQGIGTHLLGEMLGLLRRQGYAGVSLSVQKANYAVEMYRDAGFRTISENTEECIMLCDLLSADRLDGPADGTPAALPTAHGIPQ